MNRCPWVTSTLLVVLSAVLAAQAPSPAPSSQELPNITFKVEINYVEVDARAFDAQGKFVRDLKQEDFQITEDGTPQTVTTFALVDIPVEKPEVPLFAREPIEPDVVTNARNFDGRLYLFVLDDLHTSALRTQHVKNAAKKFIETRLAANDRAAVVTVRGSSDSRQAFTGNRRLLLQAVDHFMGGQLTSSTMLQLALQNQTDAANVPDPVTGKPGTSASGSSDPADIERCLNAVASMRTLQEGADFLAGVRGRRKALVYVSEGVEYDVSDFHNACSARVAAAAQEAIAAATRSNVSIYSIDPRGLTTLGDDTIDIASPTPDLGIRSLQREQQFAQLSLRVLADGTGGFAAVNTNSFATAFDRIVAENSSYYLLGYYPPNDRREGKTRKIQVKVRRPGVQVLARKDYIEPRGRAVATPPATAAAGTSATLVEAINSPLPLSGLTLSATAAAFKGTSPDASVSVVVQARGRDLSLKAAEEGKYTGHLELSVWAFDKDGKFKTGERSNVTFGLRPETFTQVQEFGVNVLLRLNLPPGRYQLRVGALTRETGLRGTVFYDLEIPDFSKGPLNMSGLLLTSLAASRAVTIQPDPLLADVLPAAPSTLREFPVNDDLALFAEVYDNQITPTHTVDLATSVLTDEGRVVFTNTESRSSLELEGKQGGYGYSPHVSLKDLPAGLYVLKVEARSRVGQAEPIVRQVQFRIKA